MFYKIDKNIFWAESETNVIYVNNNFSTCLRNPASADVQLRPVYSHRGELNTKIWRSAEDKWSEIKVGSRSVLKECPLISS